MKKVISLLMAITMAVSMLIVPINVSAAEYVSVYMDDKEISFPTTDARPQIIDSRTYVPVRKTCDELGLTLDWNSKTETLTFTRENMTIAHTMRSKVIYVNGKAVQFDTPSINKNNRILMPIRMLAESIGAKVEWDNDKRSVFITSPNAEETNSNSGSNNKPSQPTATANGTAINSISASKASAKNGEEITIKAIANNKTEKVKFINTSNNSTISEVNKFVTNADGTRTFTLEHTCINDTSSDAILNISAVPGTLAAYSEKSTDVKVVGIIVTTGKASSGSESSNYKSDYMLSCKLTNTKVQTEDDAKVRIRTTKDISKVKVTNSFNSRTVTSSNYDTNSDDERTFDVNVPMVEDGNQKLYVYLYVTSDKDYEDVYETLNITVDDDYDEDDDDENTYEDELTIINLWTNNSYAYRGYTGKVYVETSKDIRSLEICNEDQDLGEGETTVSPYQVYDDYKLWEFDFKVRTTGDTRYTLYAANADDETTKKTFSMEGKPVRLTDALVLNVNQVTNSVMEGETVQLDILVTGAANRIKINKGSSYTVLDEEIKTSSRDTRTVTLEFEVDDVTADYYVIAYNKNDSYDERYKFKLIGDIYEAVKIDKIAVSESTVSEDDDVQVTVTTNKSAEKVWIEDNRGDRASSVRKKATSERNGKYIWEISFTPTKTGRVTYTVIAESSSNDKDSNTDEKYFTLTVK